MNGDLTRPMMGLMTRRILFLSEKNSSWTLVAHALVQSMTSDIEVCSAGLTPDVDGGLPDAASFVLKECGIDIDGIQPSPLGDAEPLDYDVVVLDSKLSLSDLDGFSRIGIVHRVVFNAPPSVPCNLVNINAYRLLCGEIGRWILKNLTSIRDPRRTGERAMWLNSWIDDRRKSLYDRSSVILSADAILAAAASVLLGFTPSLFTDADGVFDLGGIGTAYVVCFVVTAVLILFSIANAITGLGNAFRRRKKLWKDLEYPDKPELPDSFPFYPPGIDELSDTYEAYRTKFVSILTNDTQLVENAAVQFRVTCKEFKNRYRSFRWSVGFLLFSIPFFGGAVLALLAAR